MASLNPKKLLQLIKLSSGDGKEPNFDFIHPEWLRLPVLSKGAQELFGGRQPFFAVHHPKMAKWLCLASTIRDFFHAGNDAEGVPEVPLRAP